ncbi:MAG: hypothetical protein WBV28_21375 [Terracidiphilus sp.]
MLTKCETHPAPRDCLIGHTHGIGEDAYAAGGSFSGDGMTRTVASVLRVSFASFSLSGRGLTKNWLRGMTAFDEG